MIIYCDGSLIQGSDSAICIVIDRRKPKIITLNKKRPIFQLEYLAIIYAFESAKPTSTIFSDEKNIVLGLNKRFGDKKNYIFYAKALDLMDEKKLKLVWVSREKNLAGKHLEKRVKEIHKYFEDQREYVNKQKRKRFKK